MSRSEEFKRLSGSGFGRTRTAALAKQISLVRTARNAIFNDNLFSEPDWDILLLLTWRCTKGIA